MNRLHTYERFVTGEDLAAALASHLIRCSCWFLVDPWPEDQWCFTLKKENEHLFDDWMSQAVSAL